MCGIVGYTGHQPAAPILIQGLRDLEYRGYDSAGLAVLEERETVRIVKRQGKIGNLEAALHEAGGLFGSTGIGHTRWATHGVPSDANAHPHESCNGEVAVIHNGIVENYAELLRELEATGHRRASETDTEVIAHLMEDHLAAGADLLGALHATAARLKGSQAILAMSALEPGVLVAARIGNAGGLVIGHGDGQMFLSSDLASILPHSRRVTYLTDGDFARITASGATYTSASGHLRELDQHVVPFDPVSALKGPYQHFMEKETMEQPEALADTIRSLTTLEPPAVHLDALGAAADRLDGIDRVVLIAMGTSYHAAMIGQRYIERFGGLPASIENASEFRYRDLTVNERTLVISISQSGETVDVLEAMAAARLRGALQVTICNTEGAQTTRVADGTVYTRAGIERCVASTKTLTCSIAALYCLALKIGVARGTMGAADLATAIEDLSAIPDVVGKLLTRRAAYRDLAAWLGPVSHLLVLGRGTGYAAACEGALKLKELSYVHAEGYAAGEMKHGPIALIDESCPTIAVATANAMPDKMQSNIQQVRSRSGRVLGILTEGDTATAALCDRVVEVPAVAPLLEPIAAVIPLQCIAYELAVRRGCDVDQPRNLAKTVTVE